jgi:uncharacterized protein YndB with AHSA1/START domain
MTEQLGVYRSDEEGAAVRFERTYDATPEEVWAAVTEPESIRRWLFADAVVEPRAGGAFRLVWSENESAGGAVLAWEPPKVLEVEWNEGEDRTILRIEIAASNGGAVLVLDHRNLTPDIAIGLGAGWHSHLDALGEVLAGHEAVADRWRPRYEALRPEYEEIVSAR